jgi:large subunit ribosomal protein L18
MAKMTTKQANAERRAGRARAKVFGTAERPRLSVFISNKHIIAQVINDTDGKTLAFATTVKSKATGTMSEKAAIIGAEVAEKAKKAKVSKVVFDRGSKLYAGRLSALANAAREKGLEF